MEILLLGYLCQEARESMSIDWLGFNPFSTIFQSFHGNQFTFSNVSWFSHTSTPHNILSKQLTAFPHRLLNIPLVKDEWRMSKWLLSNVGKNVDWAGIQTHNPWIDSPRGFVNWLPWYDRIIVKNVLNPAQSINWIIFVKKYRFLSCYIPNYYADNMLQSTCLFSINLKININSLTLFLIQQTCNSAKTWKIITGMNEKSWKNNGKKRYWVISSVVTRLSIRLKVAVCGKLFSFSISCIHVYYRLFKENGLDNSGITFGSWLVFAFPVSLLIFIGLFCWLTLYFRGCG